MKIVLNDCFGGFSFSSQFSRYLQMQNLNPNDFYGMNIGSRTNPKLIESIEYFKNNNLDINGDYSSIKIFEISDNFTDIMFKYYDGLESIIYVKDGKLYDNNNIALGEM